MISPFDAIRSAQRLTNSDLCLALTIFHSVRASANLLQGVLTGIGFLGAGVIMHAQGKDEVHGLTTAATIWISAIVGVICGAGQFLLAISIFAIAWLLLIGGRWMERRIVGWTVARNQGHIDDEAKPEARVAQLQGSESSLTSDRNQDGTHA